MVTPDEVDPDLPKRWTPEAQQRYLDAMAVAGRPQSWYCKPDAEGRYGRACDGNPHGAYDYQHARADQWPPPMNENWSVFALCGGRGSGKTRAGAEMLRHMTRYTGRLALVAPTASDLRDTMIEGESGIMRVCENAGYRPTWEPSKRRLTFPNGAIAIGYTAEEPDRFRGANNGFAWVDEAAHYPRVEYVWDMLMYGMRMGTRPRVCVTTTPTPIPWLRALLEDPGTRISKVSTFANAANLAPAFIEQMRHKYAGTRQGRQELYADLLDDIEGALWTPHLLQTTSVPSAPTLTRVVVGVDPAGTSTKRSDETGIVVVGLGVDGHLYVLADYSGVFSPHEWAANTYAAVSDYNADLIVAEKNYGGDMVRTVLDSAPKAPGVPDTRIKMVTSRKGKLIRAEPIFSLFEQERAHMVTADMPELEKQLCSWVPGSGDSPDRMDAMVHAATELAGTPGGAIGVPSGRIPMPGMPGQTRPKNLMKKMLRGALYGR